MRVINIIDSLARDKGGLNRAVSSQCLCTSKLGIVSDLAWPDRDDHLLPEAKSLSAHGVQLIPVTRLFPLRRMLDLVAGYDVVHIHGIWRPFTALGAFVALIKGKPLVITPHGMLEPWSLKQKWLKKRIALLLYERFFLNSAAFLQATVKDEAEHFSSLGLKAPKAVIPYCLPMPRRMPSPRNVPGNLNRLLFISRIHPKKGVLELLRAVSFNRKIFKKHRWLLTIAGPDEDGHLAVCRAEAKKLKLDGLVEWLGPVEGMDKWALYRSAKAFVLPTYSENFGIVVPEALVAGVPVLTTQGAPWEELEQDQCGWWIALGQTELNKALAKLLATPPTVLRAMGRRGIKLVHRRYAWPAIGKQLIQAYQWALGRGTKPSFVEYRTSGSSIRFASLQFLKSKHWRTVS